VDAGVYPNQAVYFVALTAATVAMASVSWFAFERPINGLKRYFPYDGRPVTPSLTAAPARTFALPSVQLGQRAVGAALLAVTFLLLIFVALPEALGDRPYNALGH
jgi:hypothetical protein